MSNITATELDYSPGVLSLLPLFYVGWSDSVLSPSEMKLIHRAIDGIDFLSDEDKAYLIKWTDPTNPPPEEVFKSWVHTIKKHSKDLPDDKKTSLVDLGLEIATASTGYKSDLIWKSPDTKSALGDIESALGIQGQKSWELLLSKVQPTTEEVENNRSFDPESMRKYLDGDKVELAERMRKLLRDPEFQYKEIPDKDEYRNHILHLTKELAKQGVSAYAFPKKYGGFDRTGDHIKVFEMLSYGDLSLLIKFGVQFGLFGGAVFNLGTDKHHAKYLESLGKGELLGCFAMTETGHGSNVNGLETTATYDHATKTIVVHSPNFEAGKEYIGNAMHSTMAAVFAQLIVNGQSHGVHAILVPLRDQDGNTLPGVKVKDCGYKLRLNGVDNGRIWFDHVKVPMENLLDKYGTIVEDGSYQSSIENPNKRFFTMLGALVVGRVCVGMAGISATKSALTIATKYALKRRQFSSKTGMDETLIMDYPSHQHRLIPRLAKTYAYHFALQNLADKLINANENEMREVETLAAGLKSKATWHATDSIQTCREACGGKGYLAENRFGALKADTDIFTTFEGDNTVLMQLVAKGLLTEFKQSFHDEGNRAVIKYLYNRFSNTIQEWNLIQTRNTSTNHILSKEFHFDAFRYRREKLLYSISQRMRDYLKKRINPFQAFLRCQVHMLELAHAFIDEVVLKSFMKARDNCPDEKSKEILNNLCKLYALDVIQENKGWFLENDFMDGNKSKAIRRIHAKLIAELRPDVLSIVDSFGIPEELLGAEIVI